MSKVPHYATFSTEIGSQYVFDGPTGAVIPTSALMDEAIALYATRPLEDVRERLAARHDRDEVDGVLDFVVRWSEGYGGFYRQDQHDLSPGVPEEIAGIGDHLGSIGMPTQLILHVTENCNVRCSYCIFSETYEYTRNRTKVRMSSETALRAVDHFFALLAPMSRRIPGKVVNISFYGGEPLQAVDLMRQVVAYGREHSPVPITFSVVTSGTLMTNRTIDFLVENDLKVAISLDGNKDDHDRNRKFPNGKGTFDTVYRNIKRIQARHPGYANLYILAAYDYKTDFERNIEFFEEHDLPPILFVSPVRAENTDYYSQFSDEDRERFAASLRRTADRYLSLRKEGRPVPQYLAGLYDVFAGEVLLRDRHGDSVPGFPPHTSACLPGMKLSVRPDGTLDMCERINPNFPIGDIDIGLDDQAIHEIVRSYKSTVAVHEECSECVFNRNCSLCFATVSKSDGFQRDSGWCDSFRRKYIGNLSGTYSILEANASAFDFFYGWSEESDRKKSLLYRCNRTQVFHTIEPRSVGHRHDPVRSSPPRVDAERRRQPVWLSLTSKPVR